jgi:LysM repeat protein
MDVKALLALNGMKKRTELKQGQRIVLLNTTKQSIGTDSSTTQASKYDKDFKSAAASSYFVKKGETLENIAKLCGTDVNTLRKLNNIKGTNALPAGKKIQLAKVDMSAKTSMNDATADSTTSAKSSKAKRVEEKAPVSKTSSKISSKTASKADDSSQKTRTKNGAAARVAEPAKASAPKVVSKTSTPPSAGTKAAVSGKTLPEKPAALKSTAGKTEATAKVAGNSKVPSKKRTN